MIFSTYTFLVFFACVFVAQWILLPTLVPERFRLRALHVLLLVASYIFYMFSVWEYGLLIAVSTLVDYVAGLILAHYDRALPEAPPLPPRVATNFGVDGVEPAAREADTPNDAEVEAHVARHGAAREAAGEMELKNTALIRRTALLLSLAMNLGILAYFKYSDFFIVSVIQSINAIAPGTVGPEDTDALLFRFILPVGISFFTFQSMSYTIDVYRGVMFVERNFVRFALFVSFFPQLVAGPIVTAKEFIPQLYRLPRFDFERMRTAGRWFALGYFKKVVLADNMAPIVDQIYARPELYDAAGHWLGAWAFWVQVYCDFSGYSDMAWGTAIFLGYALPENFRLPYLSKSVTEHWQRWHISLIRWNRDYLYFPLGGNRAGFWRHKFNVWFTMFAAGVWHGANWTFALWGAIHGLILAVESAVRELRKKSKDASEAAMRAAQQARAGAVQGAGGERGAREKLSASSASTSAQGAGENGRGAGKKLLTSEKKRARPLPRWRSERWYLDVLKFTATSFVTVFFGTMFRSANINDAFLIMERMLFLNVPVQALSVAALEDSVMWGVLFVYAGHVLGWYVFERKWLRDFRLHAWVECVLWVVFVFVCWQFGYSGVAPFIYFVF